MLEQILQELKPYGARLVAVSKTKPNEAILDIYTQGQRIFGENKVQEMVPKHESLPEDIEWHLIGHLQSNKIKYIAPFVHLIHSVDSLHLLQEIDRQAQRCNRIIPCLLQIKIAKEDSKMGLSETELLQMLESPAFHALQHVDIQGLMGMATHSDDPGLIRDEFRSMRQLFESLQNNYFGKASSFRELSMGMSDDYHIALEEGSTLVRIGSLLFGAR